MTTRSIVGAGPPCIVAIIGAIICSQQAGAATRLASEYFPMSSVGSQQLPFSEAVKVGSTLYLAGQIGNLSGTTTLAPGGIIPETRQAMDNIKAVLEKHGATMGNIVKCTIFLADIGDWVPFNEIYRTYFGDHYPARSALAARGLAFGARVEVDCIAALPNP
jgi:2-iminobutanoate/2-iminopropanoate deaminase